MDSLLPAAAGRLARRFPRRRGAVPHQRDAALLRWRGPIASERAHVLPLVGGDAAVAELGLAEPAALARARQVGGVRILLLTAVVALGLVARVHVIRLAPAAARRPAFEAELIAARIGRLAFEAAPVADGVGPFQAGLIATGVRRLTRQPRLVARRIRRPAGEATLIARGRGRLPLQAGLVRIGRHRAGVSHVRSRKRWVEGFAWIGHCADSLLRPAGRLTGPRALSQRRLTERRIHTSQRMLCTSRATPADAPPGQTAAIAAGPGEGTESGRRRV